MFRNKDLQDDRLIIFGRYPVPGQTKTRLIPDLGPAGAAELQRQLTEKVIFRGGLHSIPAVKTSILYSPPSDPRQRTWPGNNIFFS